MLQARDLAPAPAATAVESARIHVERLAGMWGVAPGTLPELRAIGEVKVRGGSIARLAQEIDGLPVWGRELRVLVRPGGELATASGTLVGITTPHRPAHFIHDDAGAIARAVERTYGSRTGIVVEEAKAKRVWYPVGGQLVAATVVDAFTSHAGSTNGDANRTIIAGEDGRVLAHHTLVADADFSYRVFAETTGELHPLDGPIVDSTPHPTGTPDGSYPAYVAPSLITVSSLNGQNDPWLDADATETNGNNVDAYADFNSPSGLSEGDFRADVTAPGVFDRVYDTAAEPLASVDQQKAAITSLFFVINWLHDFWYDAGFTEAAGNAQKLNFGRGGEEGDAIRAEAQDNANGGSRNNANMSTPGDGMSPRMQVFLWSGKQERTLSLQPSGRTPSVGTASFGPKQFDVAGELIVGDDGAGANTTDGCEALTNTVTGKIVLVDRGNCTFKTKALNIQNAGGIGMILANNQAGSSPPGMGDDDMISTAITIGALSVTQAEGTTLKADIAAGTCNAALHRQQFQELDGSLDSTLIAHEFGHYVHHRLSECSNQMCGAMSEGWGDFLALLLLARDGDDLDGAYPFSVYTTQSFSGDPAYYGIRRAPYSVNTDINALSFRHMSDDEDTPTNHPFNASGPNSEVHNAGEVWAAALWEVYVALQKAGSSFDDVRAKMAQYVVAGLLLTPTDATPLEVRDSILAAAIAAGNAADHDIIMEAFARRGFGSCAVAPQRTDFTDLVESTIVAGNPRLETLTLTDDCDKDGVLDSGETAKLKINVANKGHAALTDVKLEVVSTTPGVTVVSAPTTVASLDRLGTTDIEVEVKLEGATMPLEGDLSLEITATGACEPVITVPIGSRLNVDDVAEKAAIDSFDAGTSVWTASTEHWAHVRTAPLDGEWHGADQGSLGDVQLTSPLLQASATDPLVITFQHAYSFEASQGKFWDGGVIEYSIDDGTTWEDVSALATPGYDGVLTDEAENPLGNRMAYSGDSPSWPDPNTETLDFGTALAGKQFRIRFRIGTDLGTGAPGWTIDDVEFSGIDGTPFPVQVADDGECTGDPEDPEDPEDPMSGGGGCCDAGPLRGESALLAFGVLGLVLRRRRRR